MFRSREQAVCDPKLFGNRVGDLHVAVYPRRAIPSGEQITSPLQTTGEFLFLYPKVNKYGHIIDTLVHYGGEGDQPLHPYPAPSKRAFEVDKVVFDKVVKEVYSDKIDFRKILGS